MAPRSKEERFPVEPLLHAAGMPVHAFEALHDMSNGYFRSHTRRGGLPLRHADMWANRLGLHPSEIWPAQWAAVDHPEETAA